MENITATFVVYPTRIANFVHYLTHGKTINPVKVNEDKFQEFLKYLETKQEASNWRKLK